MPQKCMGDRVVVVSFIYSLNMCPYYVSHTALGTVNECSPSPCGIYILSEKQDKKL